MASVSLTIKNHRDARRFDDILRDAGAVATDMISVRTAIRDGTVIKTVQTECSGALAVFRAKAVAGAGYA